MTELSGQAESTIQKETAYSNTALQKPGLELMTSSQFDLSPEVISHASNPNPYMQGSAHTLKPC